MKKWIKFDVIKDRGNTKVWGIETNEGAFLGQIKWYSPWRKYTFFPYENTFYENKCLRDIAEFIEARMRQRL